MAAITQQRPPGIFSGRRYGDFTGKSGTSAVLGTLVLSGFKQWTGSAHVSITVPFVKVCRASTGAVVLELTDKAVDSGGDMTPITDNAIVPLATHVVFGFNADGTLSFKKTVVAS